MVGARIQDDFNVFDLELAEIQNKNAPQLALLAVSRSGKGGKTILPAPKAFAYTQSRPAVELGEGGTCLTI